MSKSESFKGRVPPGSETGIYYIPIGNLPFNAPWQRLKDFVRQVASVDHIEVFPSSTSGWVRVKGHENFKRAFKHLDGGIFQGRALIAKGDNATKEIMIRDLHLPAEPAPTSSTSATPPFSPATTSQYTQSEHPHSEHTQSEYPRSEYTQSEYPQSEYPQSEYLQIEYSGSDHRQSEHAQSTKGPEPARQRSLGCNYVRPASSEYANPYTSYPYNASTSYDLPIHMAYAASTSAAVASPAIYAPVLSYPTAAYYSHTASGQAAGSYYDSTHPAATPDPYYLAPATTTTSSTTAFEPTTDYVDTEKRKLFIKDISYHASRDQILQFVREKAGADASAIVDISLPIDGDGKLKYIAFVLFATAEAARRAQRRLHHQKFKGRQTYCRLTCEGVSERETSARGGGKKDRGRSRRDRERKGGNGRSGGGGGGDSSSEESGSAADKSSVVIADGSTKRKNL